MKRILAFTFAIIVCHSCQTFVSGSGEKHRQLFSVKDRTDLSNLDTTRFAVQPFNSSDYLDKVAYKDGKHFVVQLTAEDLDAWRSATRSCYFYFWDQHCPRTRPEIDKLDSLEQKGREIVIISWRQDIEKTDALLKKTSFSKYPYYLIDSKNYSNVLLKRKISFCKAVCSLCYDEYRDDLAVADFLVLEHGKYSVIMYNDKSGRNLLQR